MRSCTEVKGKGKGEVKGTGIGKGEGKVIGRGKGKFKGTGKVQVKLSLCFTKHNAMKTWTLKLNKAGNIQACKVDGREETSGT
jgi:hypothetical protein